MDEAALRAMMPMSFGKKPVKKTAKASQLLTASTQQDGSASTSSSAPLGTSLLGKRAATEIYGPENAGDEDDGLTAEEREANRLAQRRERERRAQGVDSDDDSEDYDNDDDVGPPPPPKPKEFEPSYSATLPRAKITRPPLTNEAMFRGTHSKTLSALAVDASGSRFALGSYDYNLSMYDFGGMTSSLAPFRLFEPSGSYPVLDLSFSSNGGNLLVVSGTSEAKLFSRDGAELSMSPKGDPYLRDMRNTRGHVSALTCGMWDPQDTRRFFTAGSDSTVRIWNGDTLAQGQEDIIVLKSKTRGNRTKVTALQTVNSSLLASGQDGSLAFWDLRSNLNSKPRGSVEKAHEAESITSSIAVGQDGCTVASRGGDGTVKLWDLRKFKDPTSVRAGLASHSAHTSVIFDPVDSRSILTCVSATPTHAGGNGNFDDEESHATETSMRGGKIVVFDSTSLDVVEEHPVPASPVRLHWSGVTDQLYCTHRNGSLSIYYSPGRSTKGVTMAVGRASKSRSVYTSLEGEGMDSYPIFEGNSTDLAQSMSESAKRRKLAKARQDPVQTRIPQKPIDGPGRGGRIGAAATQHVVQSIYAAPDSLSEDPREALLKYANKQDEKDEPQFTKAWKLNQPKPVYSKYSSDDEKE